MYMEKTTTSQQNHRIIVCLPKYNGAQKPTFFRPITLLNVDYKILAKILVNRLRPLLAEHLHTNQFCGVPGNIIMDTSYREGHNCDGGIDTNALARGLLGFPGGI
jgi:hypothetical protein